MQSRICFKSVMTFNFRGIQIKIRFLFFAVVCIMLCFDTQKTVGFAVISALLHECGHLAALIAFGDKPREVTLGLFGMQITRRNDTRLSFSEEIKSALAGPIVNLLLAGIAEIGFVLFGVSNFQMLCAINLLLGFFNLMPIMNLDGGRALFYALQIRFAESESERLLKIVSVATLAPMMAVGFYVLLITKYNFSLLAVVCYLCVLLFIKSK